MANEFAFGTATGGVDTALTAAGSTIADALQLAAAVNVFGTVALSTGAKLIANVNRGNPIVVRNGGANALAVYPNSTTGVINAGSAGAAFSVTAAKTAIFFPHGTVNGVDTWTAILGA